MVKKVIIIDYGMGNLFSIYKKLNRIKWNKPTKTYPKSVRGGSWMDKEIHLRSAARRASDPQWKKRDPILSLN